MRKFLLLVFILSFRFAFSAVPTITSFSPSSASIGVNVTITGTNFTGITGVNFGGTSATSFTVVSATQITAIVPAGTSGSINVLNIDGTGSKTGFTYLVTTLTNIFTDFSGYWASSTTSPNSVVPNTSHNLLGFMFNGTTYSTGANDAVLASHSVTYAAGNFRALPVAGIAGTSPSTSSTYAALAKKVDGSLTVANAPAVSNYSVRVALTDGINGLDLGTGITNLPTTAIMSFSIFNINPTKVSDDEPDIIITQIAQPVAGNDVFSFIDGSGAVVGTSISQDMTQLGKFGTYDLDLFNLTPNTPWNTATVYSANMANTNREIRLVGFKLSDFGITSGNVSQVKALKITPSGNSDYAFIAYNANAINIPPNITANDAETNSTICSGGVANLAVIGSASSGGVLSYSWERSTNAGSTWSPVSNGGIFSNATTEKLSIAGPASGEMYRATVAETGNPNTSTSAVFTITVNVPTAPSAVSITGSSASCLNDGLLYTSSVTGGSNLFYQWQSNTSGSYVDIADANNATYAPPVNATGSIGYRLKVSSGSGCPGEVISSAVTLTVSGISSVTPATRCSSGTVGLNAVPSSGTVSWFTADAGGSSVFTGNSYSPTLSSTTTYYVATSGCSASLRVPVTATVDPSTAGGTVNGGTTVTTETNSTTLTLASNTGSVLKWQSSTDNFGAAVSDIVNNTTSLTVNNLTVTSQFRALVQSGTCPATNSIPATITVSNATMPIHFTSVKASPQQNGILLQWSADEENVDRYEIERSADGRFFANVHDVASGKINGKNNYSWLDTRATEAINFYRIKSIDANESIAFSSIVKTDRGQNAPEISFYPNPLVDASVNIQLKNKPEGVYQIKIINGTGQQMNQATIAHTGTLATYNINFPNSMRKGIYVLVITGPDKTSQIFKLTAL